MSSTVKTVAFSPLRQGKLSLKNTLDAPFKLKWPDIPAKIASQILLILEESLSPMKECFSRRAKRKPQSTDKGKSVSKSDSDALEPPRKRQCLNESKEVSVSENKVLNSDAHPDQSKNTVSTRKSQLVIGVNNVTRCLERNELAAGCVCLTAKPALVTRHILMLAATRSVPFVALPNLSQKVVEAVGGIKSALAIGFKTCSDSEFSNVIQIISRAPPIVIPWLTAFKEHSDITNTPQPISLPLTTEQPEATPITTTSAHDSTLVPIYTPVNIKKTISGTRKRKRRNKQ